jgi:hypothetical protein
LLSTRRGCASSCSRRGSCSYCGGIGGSSALGTTARALGEPSGHDGAVAIARHICSGYPTRIHRSGCDFPQISFLDVHQLVVRLHITATHWLLYGRLIVASIGSAIIHLHCLHSIAAICATTSSIAHFYIVACVVKYRRLVHAALRKLTVQFIRRASTTGLDCKSPRQHTDGVAISVGITAGPFAGGHVLITFVSDIASTTHCTAAARSSACRRRHAARSVLLHVRLVQGLTIRLCLLAIYSAWSIITARLLILVCAVHATSNRSRCAATAFGYCSFPRLGSGGSSAARSRSSSGGGGGGAR